MLTETTLQRVILAFFRLSIGWVFLGAGLRQVPDATWSAADFLSRSPNFPGFFKMISEPPFIGIIDFIVPWLHLLVGLALMLGICMKIAGTVGAAQMFLLYIPRFEFPGFLEYHLIYTVLIIYLVSVGAGRFWGLEAWLTNSRTLQPYFARHPVLLKILS